jgi:hypothetical protein
MVERGKINTFSTQIDDCSLYWLGTGTSIKSNGVKLVLWAHSRDDFVCNFGHFTWKRVGNTSVFPCCS